MTLQQLVYAVKIADTKSMNKAAAELYVSQPALSSTIRDLEEELNIELFIRTNRGIVITAEGDEFLSYARQMVELNQMIEDRYINNEKKKNKFSVSMQHYSFAVEAFIELAKEIRLDDFELAVHETRTNEVIEFVRDYRSELGILYLNEFNRKALQKIFSENGLEFTELFDCDVFVYLSNEHPLAEKEEVHLTETLPYKQIIYKKRSGLRHIIDELFEQINAYPEVSYEIEEDQVAAGFVANGFGIAIAPDIPILHSLDVKILPLVSPAWQRRFYMAMLKDVYHPPVVEEFKKFVIAQTREDLFYKKH